MSQWKINPFEYGNSWVRADFHLHTKADKEFKHVGKENDFISKYVEALKTASIRLAVITNHNKFDKDEYKAISKKVVFTRMIAGPMDYTPGSMRNSTKGKFFTDFSNPMSHGTRCHQLGMYVVYYSPMQMLCDAPTAYQTYPDILAFLSEVPVSWDETVTLDGRIGEFVVLARRKGKDWYLGALTDWSERELEVDLSFLGAGKYQARIFADGINANRHAEDYRVIDEKASSGTCLKLTLKSGGGAAVQFKAD